MEQASTSDSSPQSESSSPQIEQPCKEMEQENLGESSLQSQSSAQVELPCKEMEQDSPGESSSQSQSSELSDTSVQVELPCKEMEQGSSGESSSPSQLSELSPPETSTQVSSKEMEQDFPRESSSQSETAPVVSTSKSMVKRQQTGLVYHEVMKLHKCEWDPNYPECPDRIDCIMARLEELDLVEKCKLLEICDFGLDYILCVHTEKHISTLEAICKVPKSYKEESQKYDAIYFNKDTYQCALKASNAALTLVAEISSGKVHNGLAVIRPPGHHAQEENFNGYCFFNNVCIATEYLLRNGFQKILIVDVDVHHGQGTQRKYYDSKNVLYFSIHRYEHGTFWPCLEESNFNFIGKGDGEGYNINVPLNCTKCTDTDYMSIITHILLPVAFEFNPDFILISGGYDACIGCPEGEMQVTPGFYGHLIMQLSGLAEGKMAVLLEGGYFLPSLAEGVAMTLRGLLDRNPPILNEMHEIHPEVVEVINNLKVLLRNKWACFGAIEFFDGDEIDMDFLHRVRIRRFRQPELKPPFEIINCYPKQEKYNEYKGIVDSLKQEYGPPVAHKVCYYSFNDEFFKDYENRSERVEYNEPPYFAYVVNAVQNKMMEIKSPGIFAYESPIVDTKLFYCPRKACNYFQKTFKLKKMLLLDFSSMTPIIRPKEADVLEFNFNKDYNNIAKYRVNICNFEFTCDADYLHVLFKLVLPISYQFAPDGVVISLSEDEVHKFQNFCHIVNLLKPLGGGRLFIIMNASQNTLKAMDSILGDPLPKPINTILKPQIQNKLHDLICVLKNHWSILDVDKPSDIRVIMDD